jgi:hypothetical protein
MALALERIGQPAAPMHMALHSIPLTIAVRFGIPLVVWGENSAFEYGGRQRLRDVRGPTDDWLRHYGVTGGTAARDWVGPELSRQDLEPYFGPDEAAVRAAGVQPVFLGSYFLWDPQLTWAVASAHGFARDEQGPRTGLWDYADIDDEFISVHHHLKWYKFGLTRLMDNLALEIRHGRLSRDMAIEILRQAGDPTPHDDIAAYCRYLEIPADRFAEISERFRNRDIWTRRDGVWMIDDFLVPDWEWT